MMVTKRDRTSQREGDKDKERVRGYITVGSEEEQLLGVRSGGRR